MESATLPCTKTTKIWLLATPDSLPDSEQSTFLGHLCLLKKRFIHNKTNKQTKQLENALCLNGPLFTRGLDGILRSPYIRILKATRTLAQERKQGFGRELLGDKRVTAVTFSHLGECECASKVVLALDTTLQSDQKISVEVSVPLVNRIILVAFDLWRNKTNKR